MAVNLKDYDAAEYLGSEDAIRAYLEEAFADGDPRVIRMTLADIARARGMSEIAGKAGLSRMGLYKALGEGGNPSFETMQAILRALGLRLTVATAV